MGKVKHPFQYGAQKEKLVAQRLQSKGYSTSLSNGSRGPSDIKARGPKRWDIQVKASCKNEKTPLSLYERRRIKIQASKDNAIPVHAQVCGDRVVFRSVRTGKKLHPWGGESILECCFRFVAFRYSTDVFRNFAPNGWCEVKRFC